MPSHDYQGLCDQLKPIVRKVGTFIKNEVGKVREGEIETKGNNSLVSYVDKTAETMLVESLSPLIDDAGFITEEETIEQQTNSDILWIIDPLDGTNNFLHGIPHFAVSVALSVYGEIVVSLVLEVNSEELFTTYKGGGAYLNDKPIRVSSTAVFSDSLISTGFPYAVDDVAPLIRTLGHMMRFGRGVRRMGSAALDLAYVACGRFDGFYETQLNPWDVAGGALLITEAGGVITDFAGADNYVYGEQLIASNGSIHGELLDVIQKNFRMS
jgi:myo-inositol-1(or 4)-monophosphatase